MLIIDALILYKLTSHLINDTSIGKTETARCRNIGQIVPLDIQSGDLFGLRIQFDLFGFGPKITHLL